MRHFLRSGILTMIVASIVSCKFNSADSNVKTSSSSSGNQTTTAPRPSATPEPLKPCSYPSFVCKGRLSYGPGDDVSIADDSDSRCKDRLTNLETALDERQSIRDLSGQLVKATIICHLYLYTDANGSEPTVEKPGTYKPINSIESVMHQ